METISVNKQNIVEKIKKFDGRILLGIDGYIDEVWQIINFRSETNAAVPYTQMNQLAERIQQAGSGGLSIEIARKRRSFGGFTANTGNAVSMLGLNTVMLSLFGKDNIDPVYKPLADRCRVISIGESAVTTIYEFDDGKIMMPYDEPIIGLNWQWLVDALGMEKLVSLLAESDIIAIGYWSSMPSFNDMVIQICGCLPSDKKTKRLFFDFADVSKRNGDSLKKTLILLKDANKKIPMTLSMNEHEAATVFALYNEPLSAKIKPLPQQIKNVRMNAGLDEIVIHTPYYAAASSREEGEAFVSQLFCENPVRTTGAGDTFNGAYIAASAAGLNITERLCLASETVSYFLRNGTAPALEQISFN